ncbi:hypothetical protein AOLI_G00116180 [Acnodon oligacanthus]
MNDFPCEGVAEWHVFGGLVTSIAAKTIFIQQHEDAFVDLYGRQKESVFSSSWPSIVSVFSLAALGAVGFTIGAYLAQK